ncbi:MAG: tryptophan synthase subunit alpha [Deferribacteres bacterium]|nr:tryptophan synthase subunit alpha [candidate division KSB1 bacterium]MCB9511999.1 tryptophan synthase subunit alpha [Deferribacteres bacterium]
MQNLQSYLKNKRTRNEKLLSVYLTSGFPDLQATLPLLHAIADGGADFIELGVPFSDPLADGTTIQAASQQAISAGATLGFSLDIAKQFSQKSDTPILLMGYANPFMHFGWDRLILHAKEAGVRGYIIPDLPPEESEDIAKQMQEAGQSLIFLASPNTSAERIALIEDLTTSFIYAVSVTGTTGAREAFPAETIAFLQRLRQQTKHPVLVGFGISGPQAAQKMAALSDGVIVGSAMLNRISACNDMPSACQAARDFAHEIKSNLLNNSEDERDGNR